MRLILGSQSPRRQQILNFFCLPFIQVAPHFDEEAVPFEGDPIAYVKTLSQGKIMSLIAKYSNYPILTADTVVYRAGKSYGKPTTLEQGIEYLRELSGHWHSVFTGLSFYWQGHLYQKTEETRVCFNRLSDQQISAYYTALHCFDKAGGYMLQRAGSLVVNRIEGCYYNVIGMPLNALREILLYAEIDLWDYLKP